MQIANRLAGYSLGEADLLRRAMGKKKAEEMAKQRERFVEGAVQRGYPAKEDREDLRPDGASLPDTASTSRTRPPTRCWPTRRHI